ncbi:GNAT family N-acetyltransferase [Jeotgalibaca caeni]|uniref:GNAT family N-acetyltransferase n=1 Tax=Jeotgalibaca caeni TaxID=3028623 RepID=UPI00237DDE7E|nr:GNAT family protein [Jeotgalibaca caeni]MDE1548984.1 GNAT family protein [Jeotgalibaca caeni]
MIELTNLSPENVEACLTLSVEGWQQKYVHPVSDSIARAYVEPETRIPLVITENLRAVGFLFFHLYPTTSHIVLEELFVDSQFQQQGFGTAAVRAFLSYVESFPEYERVITWVDIGNPAGRKTLENAGFMRGSVDLEQRKNEMVYVIR